MQLKQKLNNAPIISENQNQNVKETGAQNQLDKDDVVPSSRSNAFKNKCKYNSKNKYNLKVTSKNTQLAQSQLLMNKEITQENNSLNISADILQKLEIFFRYNICSMIYISYGPYGDKQQQNSLFLSQQFCLRLYKYISQLSKYRYRNRIMDFSKMEMLQKMNFDVKKKIQHYNQQKSIQNKQNHSDDDLYDSHDDDDENDNKKKQQKLKIKTFQNLSIAMGEMEYWKKKHGIDSKSKIFIIMGGYQDVRHALIQRGWIENKDHNSPCFDLKWTLKVKDIESKCISNQQVVNHFLKNGCLTTKVGLARNLKNIISSNKTDINQFFPRTYDLNDQQNLEDFIIDFKVTQAVINIKNFVQRLNRKFIQKIDNEQVNKIEIEKIKENLQQEISFYHPIEIEINIKTSILICLKKFTSFAKLLDNMFQNNNCIINNFQWSIIQQNGKNIKSFDQNFLKKYLLEIENDLDNTIVNDIQIRKLKEEFFEQNQKEKNKNNLILNQKFLMYLCQQTIIQIKKYHPQYNLDGKDNLWIVKPSLLSRGRGIRCFNNLDHILDHIVCRETQYICQKYIEKPLLIHKRKFDIRQWVLITYTSPFKTYIYNQFYIRFSAIDYDPSKINDKFVHLTNNAIAKHHENHQKSKIEGNMWFMHQLQTYLQEKASSNILSDAIIPQIKQIVVHSLKSVVGLIEDRKSSFELFGYDFMIDENYNVFLIEINSSPSMDYSTHVTEKLVKNVLEDTIKLVIDQKFSYSKKNTDNGNFQLIMCQGKEYL